jgi:hypothetical protein
MSGEYEKIIIENFANRNIDYIFDIRRCRLQYQKQGKSTSKQ